MKKKKDGNPILFLAAFSVLTLTVPLALSAYIISKHSPEHKVLLRREQVERPCYNHAYSVKTLLSTEIQVKAVAAYRLDNVFDVLAFQSADCKILVLLVESEEYHTAHSLLIFVDMVHQNLHVYWYCCGLLHD